MSELEEQLSPEQKAERDALERAFRDVFATAAGKRVLFWMLEQCAMFESAYGGENTNATNFMLGKQEAGKRLVGMLDQIDTRLYPRLLLDVADLKAMERAAAERRANKENEDDVEA